MMARCKIFKMSKTFDRESTFPFTEFEWAQMMLFANENWDELPEYEAGPQPQDAIYALMHPEPKTFQEAREVIRRKDLKIERLEREVSELKEEIQVKLKNTVLRSLNH